MLRFRQRNAPWLVILGLLTTLAVIANAPLTPLLLLLFAGALGLSFIDPSITRRGPMREVAQRVPAAAGGSRISPQAREAVDRAVKRGHITMPELALTDVGLIATYEEEEGLAMRRTRTISKDDQGVRPFLVLNVAPAQADRSAKLRFEMIDQNGRELYIHEMNVYLRDGELNILADHHLPLMSNPQIEGSGDWDLRIYLDGDLVGMHGFALEPSSEDRINRLGGAGSRGARPRRYIMPDSRLQDDGEVDSAENEDVPMSLEQLLRNQKQQRGN